LARRLVKEGAAGILVPSYAPGAVANTDLNAVFWRWSTAPPHYVRVVDDAGRLPKDDSSWR
jgi:RES domain-containing protein